MRPSVPFIGEELIVRGDDESPIAPQSRLIDEVLSTSADTSSWDDFIGDKGSKPAKPHAAISRPKAKTLRNIVMPQKRNSYMEWMPINNGRCLRISVSGNMDLKLRNDWQRLMQETAASSIRQFEFNLTQTPELSLTGLGMLLLFKEQKGSQQSDIKLCHCNPQIRELLQWTGMDKYFLVQSKPLPETGND
jgi:anti-anti-sigma factor